MSNIVKLEEQKKELDYFKSLATIAAKSGTTPLSPEAIINIMLTAKDLGISPMKAINGGFYVVNGKISMSTCLMADRIRKEGHSIKIPEWTSQKCAILGTRKDNGDSIRFEFTLEDAQTAGLTGSPTWKKFPKQMLYNRAMSTLARTLFPDVVGNAYSEDEKFDIMDVPPEERPLEDPDVIDLPTHVDEKDKIQVLKNYLKQNQIDATQLDSYLKEISNKRNKPIEMIIESAMKTDNLPKFRDHYVKFLESFSQSSSQEDLEKAV